MSSTLIFVEAESDQIVVAEILEKLSLLNNTFAFALADDNLLNPGQLKRALCEEWFPIFTNNVTKIAVIRDIDNKTIADLETAVNTAIKDTFSLPTLPSLKENIPQSITIPPPVSLLISPRSIEFVCHFVGQNVAGTRTGEMENLLRLIAKLPTHISDCVDNHLLSCLAKQGVSFRNSKKSLSKLWAYNYQRFDAGNIENYRFKEADIKRNFNNMFDLDANVPELKDLINCIKAVAQ